MRPSRAAVFTTVGAGLLTLLASVPLLYAQRAENRGGGREAPPSAAPARQEAPRVAAPAREAAPRIAPEQRPAPVQRSNYGSIRHYQPQVAQPQVARPPAPAFRGEVNHEYIVHGGGEAEYPREQLWHGFNFGARLHDLPRGYARLFVGGAPYFYFGGIFYQPVDDSYQECYPPVGAEIPAPPEGAYVIYVGGVTYYYAGGAFYVQQDGGYVVAPAPIGVTVPELPPGAVQVSVNGAVAYQFNGIYYQPVFVNGVTEYTTINP